MAVPVHEKPHRSAVGDVSLICETGPPGFSDIGFPNPVSCPSLSRDPFSIVLGVKSRVLVVMGRI